MKDKLDSINDRLETIYPRINVKSGEETFKNKYGVVFHVVHVPGLELICVEYCPKEEWADTYDYDPGKSFWDKYSVDILIKQLTSEIDEIEPAI